MIRTPIELLRPDDVLARSVPNPNDPETPLLAAGFRLTERVIRLIRGIGFRSLWIEAEGTAATDGLLPEPLLARSRSVAKRVAQAFLAARAGDLPEDAVSQFRGDALALLDLLKGAAPFFLVPEDMHADPEDPALHAVNVAHLALLTGVALGDAVPRTGGGSGPDAATAAFAALGIGAFLHDIGQAGVRPEILGKEPWDLSLREIHELESHTTKGFRLLRSRAGAVAANVALAHHLRENAGDFPYESVESGSHLMGGEKIHPFSKIVALANAYDNLLTREDYLPAEALEEIAAARAAQFAPEVLAALLRIAPPFPPGSPVGLSTGHAAVVIHFDPAKPFRPRVVLVANPAGEPLPASQRAELSLADYPQVHVQRAGGRAIDHLLPASPLAGWEGVA